MIKLGLEDARLGAIDNEGRITKRPTEYVDGKPVGARGYQTTHASNDGRYFVALPANYTGGLEWAVDVPTPKKSSTKEVE